MKVKALKSPGKKRREVIKTKVVKLEKTETNRARIIEAINLREMTNDQGRSTEVTMQKEMRNNQDRSAKVVLKETKSNPARNASY